MIGVLDGGRRWVWRQVVRTSAGKACARDRSARVLALALAHLVVTLALVTAAPGWLLLLGPLVLGVPHVIADVRHLIVRGPASLSRETIVALAVPMAAMAGLRTVEVLGGPALPTAELALGFATIAVAVTLAPGRGHAIVLVAVAALAAPAFAWPSAAMLVLLHGHNLVGFAIWFRWTRPLGLAHRLCVLAALALAVLAILAGALDAAPRIAIVESFAQTLAPGLDDALAYRVVLVYALLQAMHYVVWLRLIPATQGRVSTFRRSLAGLRADFGGLAVIAALVLAVPLAAAATSPDHVRDVYLSVAAFHAWLELAVIGYLVVSRERLR
jgi:hypothetical protein